MRKNVLLCFDAFGTLFKPRQPVFKQYAEVARKYGVNNFNDDELAQHFKEAFKSESQQNPLYGHSTGMGSQKWWTSVIEKTFASALSGEDKKLPPVLAPALIHRFNSKEGYDLFPDAVKLLTQFSDVTPGQLYRRIDRQDDGMPDARLVVGVITNSDDRVPDVLTSLGLKIKPLRHGEDVRQYHPTNEPADIDFAIMSYDVGYEKPDAHIFNAGETMLQAMLRAEGHEEPDTSDWRKIYIGDEVAKDIEGSIDAGWEAVLVDRAETPPGNARDTVESRTTNGKTFSAIQDLRAVWKVLQ